MLFHVSDDSAGGKRQGFDRSAEEGSGLERFRSLSNFDGLKMAMVTVLKLPEKDKPRLKLSLLAETLTG